MGRAVLFVKRRIKRGRHITIPTGRRKVKSKSLFPRRRINVVKGRRSIYKIRKPLPRPFRRIPMPWLQATRTISRFGGLVGSFGKYTKIKKKSWSPTKSASTRRPRSSFGGAQRKPSTWSKKRAPKKAVEEVFGLGFSHYKWRQKPKTIEPHWFHPKKKVFKAPERRGGKRDLSKVVYPDYGPYPKYIDPHLIFAIRPTSDFLIEMTKRKKTNTDAELIGRMTKRFLDTVRTDLLIYADKIIGKYVPIETGDLQKAMLKSLEKCIRNGYTLRMRLSARVDHAGVVNKMPERKVRHNSSMSKRSRKTRKFLHDPLAQKTYFTYIMMNLKDKARDLIYELITKILFMWKNPPKNIQIPKSKKYIYPVQRSQNISYTYEDPEMEDREKYMKYAEMWGKTQEPSKTPTQKSSVPINRNLIKGFFKIDGLYKKKRG